MRCYVVETDSEYNIEAHVSNDGEEGGRHEVDEDIRFFDRGSFVRVVSTENR